MYYLFFFFVIIWSGVMDPKLVTRVRKTENPPPGHRAGM